jgi:3-deoxy-manno-octulosonate cytidylyltransferase (CMP-KDO synthetase)
MSKSLVAGVIPARFEASRFPGKLLSSVVGKAVIERTYERALQSQALNALFVATDDERIAGCIENIGGKALMTSKDCLTGTHRVIEAVTSYPELASFDIIVNIQGDEPCLDPHTIDHIVWAIKEYPEEKVITAVVAIKDDTDLDNPSVVKCVLSQDMHALYFSRACIPGRLPYRKVLIPISYWKHVGIYGFRKDFLLAYGKLPTTPLQCIEDLEQLKILELGFPIKVVEIAHTSPHVDLPEDIQKVEQWLCAQNISS